jgi:RNase P subunit RPR2
MLKVLHRIGKAAMHPEIPRVLCPSCGEIMRLSRIHPDGNNKSEMLFVCDCGFNYRMSTRAQREVEDAEF